MERACSRRHLGERVLLQGVHPGLQPGAPDPDVAGQEPGGQPGLQHRQGAARREVPGECGHGRPLVAQVVQALARPHQVGRVLQFAQHAGQVTGEGAEAVGGAEAGGAVAGPLQQGLGAVDGEDAGAGEGVGEEAGDDAGSAADVDDQAGSVILRASQVIACRYRRVQLRLGLQHRGHLGPVQVGVVVVVAVPAGCARGRGCGCGPHPGGGGCRGGRAPWWSASRSRCRQGATTHRRGANKVAMTAKKREHLRPGREGRAPRASVMPESAQDSGG
ncbi:hypothetical protein SGLAM104S_10059 [Streptomyces glaucescens]